MPPVECFVTLGRCNFGRIVEEETVRYIWVLGLGLRLNLRCNSGWVVYPTTTLDTSIAMEVSSEPESQRRQDHIEGDDAASCSSIDIKNRAPPRYLMGCTDEELALKRWRSNVEWREKEGMDTILTSPLHEYETFKKLFPVFICKHCVCVCVEGVANPKRIKCF